MWWQNKPMDFLQALDPERREQLHQEARSKSASIKAALREKKERLQEELQKKLAEKQAKKETKIAKEQTSKVKASREVSQYGGPWGADEVEAKLGDLPEPQQRKALAVQLPPHSCNDFGHSAIPGDGGALQKQDFKGL